MNLLQITRKKLPAVLILILCWSLLYLPNLGLSPLTSVESLRVSIAFDIKNFDGFFSADYLGEFYSNKPPIYSFILSIFLRIFNGSIEFAARLPSALCVIMTSILSLFKLNWIKNNATFLISLSIIISPISFSYGRLAEMDMIYMSLIYLSFVDLLYFFEYKKNKKKILSASILQGISFLIKGPIGISMLLVFIICKSSSIKELLRILKIFSPPFIILTAGYFLIPIKLGIISAKVLILQLWMRFEQTLTFSRYLGERLIVIFYAIIPSSIAFINKNKIDNSSAFLYKFCSSFVLLLFWIPGFQADYLAPILFLLLIPTGVVLSNYLNYKNQLKIWIFFLTLLVLLNLCSLIFPDYVNKTSNVNDAKTVLLDGLKRSNKQNSRSSKKIFLTNTTRYIAPYLYQSKNNFELMLLNEENLKSKLEKNDLREFFIISEKNFAENKDFLNSIDKSCQLIEVSKTSLRSQLFNWPDNYNSWQKESNFNLYKVNKCREKLIQKIFK